MEAEVRVLGGEVLLAPGYALGEHVEPLARAPIVEIPGKRHGHLADLAPDVEYPLVRLETAELYEVPEVLFADPVEVSAPEEDPALRRGQGIPPKGREFRMSAGRW